MIDVTKGMRGRRDSGTPGKWMTLSEAQEWLGGVNRITLKRMIDRGQIDYDEVGSETTWNYVVDVDTITDEAWANMETYADRRNPATSKRANQVERLRHRAETAEAKVAELEAKLKQMSETRASERRRESRRPTR